MERKGVTQNRIFSRKRKGSPNTYDRSGLLSTNLCNGITTVRACDSANDFLGESYSGGVVDGLSVTHGFDGFLRRTSLAVLNSNTPIWPRG